MSFEFLPTPLFTWQSKDEFKTYLDTLLDKVNEIESELQKIREMKPLKIRLADDNYLLMEGSTPLAGMDLADMDVRLTDELTVFGDISLRNLDMNMPPIDLEQSVQWSSSDFIEITTGPLYLKSMLFRDKYFQLQKRFKSIQNMIANSGWKWLQWIYDKVFIRIYLRSQGVRIKGAINVRFMK